MAIFTQYGTEVEIRYRCNDTIDPIDPYVHAFPLEDQDANPYIVNAWQLKADDGAKEIADAIKNLPLANCVGKH